MSGYHTVTVEVDLSEFDTEDLIKELRSRRAPSRADLRSIYEALKLGKKEEADRLLRQLIWNELGRIL